LVRAPVGASWYDIFRFYWCWCGASFWKFSGSGALRCRELIFFLAPTGSGAWIPGQDHQGVVQGQS